MNITEKNIFDFVFAPHSISPEMKEQIIKFPELDKIINFYKKLKNNLLDDISLSEKIKLAASIPSYQPSFKFTLVPLLEKEIIVKEIFQNTSNEQILTTFQDKEKFFLIRSHFDGLHTSLSLFPNLSEFFTTIKLIIKPEDKEFVLDSDTLNLDMNAIRDIEKIELELVK